MRALTLVLILFVAGIQAELWIGKGSLPYVVTLKSELAQAEAANVQARARNAQLQAELRDLREGLEMVEEKARSELRMIKPDEIYVQVHH
ncbi:septum formation initiator family protein [Paucibacter sp. R3-3]|uniref:Cell division protein FtsB n=1 Tax=Roseateles agri TaxID=3098619 RepID=A0ABU5DI11_9BURK|nr:septum formation initiator family protein [Paucibacter sp. R3-3]MDY0745794.1 septum formation initiator family protein [Paucibacter sp. R3-3]